MANENYENSQLRQYIERQDNCGIKVGDIVTVTRKAMDYENGWKNAWNDLMDYFINDTCFVVGIDGFNGITLRREASFARFDFPYFVLSKLPSTHSLVNISVNDISCNIEIPNEMLDAIQRKEKVTITNVTFK